MNERTRSRFTRADRPSRSLREYLRPDAIAITIALLVIIVLGAFVLDGPARVHRLTLDNPSEFEVAVDVSSGPHGGYVPLAVLGVNTTRDYQDVLDQGRTWVFRFRSQGRQADIVTVTREQLAAANWTMTVPDAAIQQLRQAGAPASPCLRASCAPKS